MRVARGRNRGMDSAVLVAAQPTAGRDPLLRDNAPSHHTQLGRETVEVVGFTILSPFCSPELNLCEHVWRVMKGTVVANRECAEVDALVERAVAWLDDWSPADMLHLAGLQSPKVD